MFRFYVFTEMKREKSPKKIHEHLLNVWGRNTPSYDSVCRWIRDFQSKERESFSDMPRSGRPSTVGNDDSVALVKQLVDEDPHISVREISIQTGISIGSVHSILRHKLLYRCVYSVWVPYHLTDETKKKRISCANTIASVLDSMGDDAISLFATEDETTILFEEPPTKRGSRVWLAADERRPQVTMRNTMTTRKVMLAIAFTANKRFSIHAYSHAERLDSTAYVNFLIETGNKWRTLRSNPIRLNQLTWQHDNARCHTSNETTAFFHRRKIELVKQSPYSPDLNLCDRFINQKLKEHIRQLDLNSAEEVANSAMVYLRSIPDSVFVEELQKLKRHCHRVCEFSGDYVTD